MRESWKESQIFLSLNVKLESSPGISKKLNKDTRFMGWKSPTQVEERGEVGRVMFT